MHITLDEEEVEKLKEVTVIFVLFYKNIWNEVEKQFADLPREEKNKIFGAVAPSIVQTFTTFLDDTTQKNPSAKKET